MGSRGRARLLAYLRPSASALVLGVILLFARPCASASLLPAPQTEPKASASPLSLPARDWAVACANNEVQVIQHTGSYLRYRMHVVDEKGDQIRDQIETPEGSVARTILRNGRPLTAEEDAAERDRLNSLIASPSTFAHHIKNEQANKKLGVDLLKLMPDAMIWSYAAGQPQPADRPSGEPALVVLDFKPNPQWSSPNIPAETLTGLEGRVWIDPRTQRMVRLEGRLFHAVNIGWGMVAHIYPGGTVTLQQTQATSERWIVDHIDEQLTVRALMVKTVKQRLVFDTSDFQPVPGMAYQQAIKMLLDTPLPAQRLPVATGGLNTQSHSCRTQFRPVQSTGLRRLCEPARRAGRLHVPRFAGPFRLRHSSLLHSFRRNEMGYVQKRVLALLLLFADPVFGSAQPQAEAGTSVLRGAVTDPSGALVPQAEVVLQPGGLKTLTTPEGRYGFQNLAPGAYTVHIAAPGFAPFDSKPIHLTSARTQTLDVRLQLETQQFQMNVSSDSADETDPNRNPDAIVLKGNALDELPTDPTTLNQELQALSGGDSPAIYVDGFSNGTLPPKNTIREIRINQNPYSARNDTDPVNGMIEIFTKPGTDKLHGSLFLLGNDSSLNTQDPYTSGQPPYYSTQINYDLDGPLNKKASYFLSGNRTSNQINAVIHASTLDSGLNQTIFSQALPSPSTSTGFTPRLDLQLGEKSTMSFRYSWNLSRQSNGGVGQLNLPTQAYSSQTVTQLLQAGNSQILGPRVVNDTRFQYIRTRAAQTPQNTSPTLNVEGSFVDGGNNAGAFHDNQDSYELQNYVSIQAGKHYLSPGVRLRVLRDANVSRAGYNGEFTFATLSAYQITEQGIANGLTPAQIAAEGGGPAQFSITTGNPAAVVDVADVAGFFQDDWKVAQHLTLSYGLRYEFQNYIFDHRDFAPRLGFSWAIGARDKKPAKFVLHGGSGIFYTRLPAADILQTERENGVSQQQYIVPNPATYPSFPSLTAQTQPTIYRISPTFHSPYSWDNTLALEHPLGKMGNVMINYIYNRGVHSLVTRNINSPYPGTYNPADPAGGTRPLGTTQNIDEYDSAGVARSRRFSANIILQAKNGFFLYSYYMLRFRDSDAGNGGFPSNEYNVGADYGRIPYDNRNNFILSVSAPRLPGRIQLSSFLDTRSGYPFNITVGQDLNGDSQFNDRPTFATDLTRPSVVATRWGAFDTSPIPGQTTIPYDLGTGPAYLSVNAQLVRGFTFGPPVPAEPGVPKPAASPPGHKPYIERKYTIYLVAEAENALNVVNPGTPVGTLGTPLFGKSIGLANNVSSGGANANRVINLLFFARF